MADKRKKEELETPFLSLNFSKKHKDAVTPTRAHPSDVGLDLVAITKHKAIDPNIILYDTGINVVSPPGYYVEIVPRSSISKTGWMLANSVGTIDPSYTGNLYIALVRVVPGSPELTVPFCKCQMILRKIEKFELKEIESEDIPVTVRGDGGFGSTGSRVTNSPSKEKEKEKDKSSLANLNDLRQFILPN